MSRAGFIFLLTLLGFLLANGSVIIGPRFSLAANPSDFAQANASITSAYSATRKAQQAGGNVSVLVSELNTAVGLYQKAESENALNPSAASSDLSNSTQIAQRVSAQAQAITNANLSSDYAEIGASSVEVVLIVLIGLFAYFFGGRLYRRAWLAVHKDQVVKPQ
jgi:hypothetical protein